MKRKVGIVWDRHQSYFIVDNDMFHDYGVELDEEEVEWINDVFLKYEAVQSFLEKKVEEEKCKSKI